MRVLDFLKNRVGYRKPWDILDVFDAVTPRCTVQVHNSKYFALRGTLFWNSYMLEYLPRVMFKPNPLMQRAPFFNPGSQSKSHDAIVESTIWWYSEAVFFKEYFFLKRFCSAAKRPIKKKWFLKKSVTQKSAAMRPNKSLKTIRHFVF